MKIRGRGFRWQTASTVVLLMAAGCGGGGDDDAATAQQNTAREAEGTVNYTSGEGDFQVAWPAGCSRLRMQSSSVAGDDDPNRPARLKVFCDRAGLENEGCDVSIQFLSRVPGASAPTPERVIETVKNIMQTFQVDILRQSPLVRGELEGIGVHCVSPVEGDSSSVWIEGYIARGNVYVLTAWSAKRRIFDLAEYATFFKSFRLSDPGPAEDAAE